MPQNALRKLAVAGMVCSAVVLPRPVAATERPTLTTPDPQDPPAHKIFVPSTRKGGGNICNLEYPIMLHGYANQTGSNSTTEMISIVQQSGGNGIPFFPYFPNAAGDLALLNQFQPIGIRLMAQLEGATDSMLNPAKEAEFVAWINAVKNHPALWGYFLYDEPELRQNFGPVTAAKAQRINTLIKQNDPNHPTVINFSIPSQAYIPYIGIADIASFDFYPVHGSGSYRTNMNEYKQQVDKFVADHALYDLTGKTKVFGTYVQAFRNDALGIREITQAEMQEMIDYPRGVSSKFGYAVYFLIRWGGQESNYPGLQQLPSLRAKAAGVNVNVRPLASPYAVKTNSPCVVAESW